VHGIGSHEGGGVARVHDVVREQREHGVVAGCGIRRPPRPLDGEAPARRHRVHGRVDRLGSDADGGDHDEPPRRRRLVGERGVQQVQELRRLVA